MIAGRCLVVGGHSRGVGKTALVVECLRTLDWPSVVTVKVSAHRHGIDALTVEDRARSPHTSTGRCLGAGAAQAFLCRCPDDRLAEAVALVRALRADGHDVIVESNRLAALVEASLRFFVVSGSIHDWKASSDACLAAADAVVTSAGTRGLPDRVRTAVGAAGGPEMFAFSADWRVPGLAGWVRSRLAGQGGAEAAGGRTAATRSGIATVIE